MSDEQSAAVLLTAAATAAASPRSREGRALEALIRSARRLPQLPKLVRQNVGRAQLVPALRKLGGASPKVQFGPSPGPANPAPTRLSFFTVGDQIHSAAITDTTTVMERVLRLDPQLVRETVERMTEPEAEDVERLARLLRNLLIHEDLAGMVSGSVPLVFEVDRSMAPVHWEMMADDQGKPLALQAAVARQLRTTYSPAPLLERAPGPLRALVVGDPGDPDAGESLPGARREASTVAALLRRKGVEVVELIGAADANGQGPIPNVAPATRLDVLDALMSGGFDILHYSGHGDFDPQQPDRVGWVFKEDLLTPGELQRVGRAPRLVVANACLSARTSFTTTSGEPPTGRHESGLAPSLADEFFRRGVQDYIGTAWPIDDTGAVLFAETLYGRLLADPGGAAAGRDGRASGTPSTAGAGEERGDLRTPLGGVPALWRPAASPPRTRGRWGGTAAFRGAGGKKAEGRGGARDSGGDRRPASAESESGQMSHVPSFEHDVFVSYAHLDNESAAGRAGGGWVDVFVRRLEKQVKQRLGSKAVDLWSDPKHAGNQPLTRDILTAARDSALLMVVMSPSYLHSEWCARERNTFLEVARDRVAEGRIFIVRYLDVPREETPSDFGDLTGFPFFVEDRHVGATRPLGEPNRSEPEFVRRIYNLSYQVAHEMTRLTALAHGGTRKGAASQTEGPLVFVARATDDLEDREEQLRNHLMQAGVRVPPRKLYMQADAAGFESAVRADLEGCKLFAQLLSSARGREMPFGGDKRLPALQCDVARRVGTKVVQSRDRALDPTTVADPIQREMLETAIACPIEEFKRMVVEEAQRQPPLSRSRPSGVMVFVDADPRDRELARQIGEVLAGLGVACYWPLEAGAPDEIRKDLEANLSDCDGVLVVYRLERTLLGPHPGSLWPEDLQPAPASASARDLPGTAAREG